MTNNPVQFTTATDLDNAYITFYAPSGPVTIDKSHPNYTGAINYCSSVLAGENSLPTAEQVEDWLNIPAAVARRFSRLSERVTVREGEVCIDGDPVNNALTDQILDFLNEGLDFAPLVRFYEKLLTNPLGDVREGLFTWLTGQRSGGAKVTITSEGDLIGYKGVWTVDGKPGVFKPSNKGYGEKGTPQAYVNDEVVPYGEYIEQREGDTVEMASREALSEPSVECGVGLHVGTWKYAQGFGPVTLAVRFNPRDVVSAPDRNSSWKLRVHRYTVIGVVESEPLNSSIYTVEPETADEVGVDLDLALSGDHSEPAFAAGDRVIDADGDEGTLIDGSGGLEVEYDKSGLRTFVWAVNQDGTSGSSDRDDLTYKVTDSSGRTHGKGGPTSQRAKGRGLNPAQDPTTGRFVAGRPASNRDPKTGRFS